MSTSGGTADGVPDVSVVVPTRNRAAYLRVCLQSIRASFDEAGVTGEIVVVDDGSTDDTPAVAEELGARLLANRSTGVSAGRNTGIAAARADLLLFLDDDDAWSPEHVRLHVAAHRADPEVGVTYSQGRLADEHLVPVAPPAPAEPLPQGWIQRELLGGRVQSFTTFAIRRHVLDEAGDFDESLDKGEDFELVQRLGSAARFTPIAQPTVVWRQHPRAAGGLVSWQRTRDQDRQVLRTTLARGAELGLGWSWRFERIVRSLGWTMQEALGEAEALLREGDRAGCRRLLAAALRTSPPHALKQRRFWSLLRRAVR